jgi:hypothetical protein
MGLRPTQGDAKTLSPQNCRLDRSCRGPRYAPVGITIHHNSRISLQNCHPDRSVAKRRDLLFQAAHLSHGGLRRNHS